MIGQTVSHYKILDKLGQGGMGVVYLAEDLKLKRKVALKFLPAQFHADEEEKKRFIHEAQAASALQHNHVATIHEIDETPEGQLFIAMAFYDGETLREKIARGPLKLEEALDFAGQLADGLQEAHEAQIVHRDIKPANIFITAKGQVKILDFGLAKLKGQTKLTKDGTTLGTVAYMSPEQARGEAAEPRSDIWALGVVLYEMLTGQQPFAGEYEQAILYGIINEEFEPVTGLRTGVPVETDRLLAKALAKDAARRYQHLADLRVDLDGLREQLALSPTVKTGLIREERGRKPAWRKPVVWVGLMAAAILMAAGLYLLLIGEKDDRSAEVIDSLAVLPFRNLGDPEQEYFTDGMHDQLLTNLQKIRALRVISRTSVYQFRNTEKAASEIADQLGVKAIIEGSVLYSGNRVRINVQLIGTEPERHLWADTFEGEIKDVLFLQSNLAQAITERIRVAVTPGEKSLLAKTHKVNPEAYEYYLKSYSVLMENSDLPKTLKYVEMAIAKDPNFAEAHAMQAYCYLWTPNSLLQIDPQEAYAKAKEAVSKALALDDTSAYARSIQANILFFADWDFKQAEIQAARAYELNPGSLITIQAYGAILNEIGKHDEAIALARKSLLVDPYNTTLKYGLASSMIFGRRFDDSLNLLKALVDSNTKNLFIAVVYAAQGRHEEAIEAYIQTFTIEPNLQIPPWRGWLGCAYAMAGHKDEAMKLLNELTFESEKKYVPPTVFASIQMGLGNMDQAFEWLDKAYDVHDIELTHVYQFPLWEPLRDDPRYHELIRKMGFPGEASSSQE
jgi:serine/threonine-protein kinase